MEKQKKPISELENDVKAFDLIMLYVPLTVHTCIAHKGIDHIAGFYCRTEENKVYLSPIQKSLEAENFQLGFDLSQIESYEVLRRFKPDPGDEIDNLLSQMLGIGMGE